MSSLTNSTIKYSLKGLFLVSSLILILGCPGPKPQPNVTEEQKAKSLQLWTAALERLRTAHKDISSSLDSVKNSKEVPVALQKVSQTYSDLSQATEIRAVEKSGVVGILTHMSEFLNRTGRYIQVNDYNAAAISMDNFIKELQIFEHVMKPLHWDTTAIHIEEKWELFGSLVRSKNNKDVQNLLTELSKITRKEQREGAKAWVNLYEKTPQITVLFFHDKKFEPLLFTLAKDTPYGEFDVNPFKAVLSRMTTAEVIDSAYHVGTIEVFSQLSNLYSLPIGTVPVMDRIDCKDLCNEVSETRNMEYEMRLIPNGHTPDSYDDLDELAEYFSWFGGAEYAEAQKKIMAKTRPQDLFVKCSWEHCEENNCWVFWTEKKWVKKESEWEKVNCPEGSIYGSPPEGSWKPLSGVADNDEGAVEKMNELAQEHCDTK